jgi:hypothetical protein
MAMTNANDHDLMFLEGGVVCWTEYGEVRLPGWIADVLGFRDCF